MLITPAFAAGLERSGKPVRQHALVSFILRLSLRARELDVCPQTQLLYYL